MTPTNSEALTATGGAPPSGPRIAQSSRDLEFHSSDASPKGKQLAMTSGLRHPGASDSISPEFRERVAMVACFAFFGVIALACGIAAFVLSMLIDWYGVAETAFRFADLG